MKKNLIVLLIISLLFISILPLFSLNYQNSVNREKISDNHDEITISSGDAVCVEGADQINPELCSDGAGGAIITWEDYRNGIADANIYAQRLNSTGSAQWTINGVAICTASNDQEKPQICSDGAGGAIITWQDYRGINLYDIYVQRINSAGVVQWNGNGVVISTASNSQGDPQICSDGASGAIITWWDERGGSSDIYAQRISSGGVVQWTANGVRICTVTNPQLYPKICSDGASGAIIIWRDMRGGTYFDVYAQRINSGGVGQWTSNGTAICKLSQGTSQSAIQICSDGASGAIITWEDKRSGSYCDIYTQRINSAGVTQWTSNGTAICTASNDQVGPQVCSDGSNGAIITWWDRRGVNYDIYAQRINSGGVVQWTPNGLAICTANGDQSYPKICSNSSGFATITWQSGNIYAQQINSIGSILWAANGTPVCIASGTQRYPKICSDGAGGAIITWEDLRGGSYYDIYALPMPDKKAPSSFSIYSPLSWINDQTPRVVCKFYEDGIGIGKSTVQFAYSTDGSSTPSNWAAVNNVYVDSACTTPAYDGDVGWLYAVVLNVPFNKDSGSSNTIRFRVTDLMGNQGTQATASIIMVDSSPPDSFSIISPIGWVTTQTPTVICRFNASISGVDVSTVQYAYSKTGSSAPTNWAAVNGVYKDAVCTINATDGDTGLIYARVLAVPFNQDSGTLNTIRFRASDMATSVGTQGTASIIQIDTLPPGSFSIYSPVGWINNQTPTVICTFDSSASGVDISTVQYAYSKIGSSAPTNWAAVSGVYKDAACTILAIDGDTGLMYAKVVGVPFNQDSATLNTIRFRANDMLTHQGIQAVASIIQVDTEIQKPLGLTATPATCTDVDDFKINWTNPADLSGIVGVYYKIGPPPTYNTEGLYVEETNITEILGIMVSIDGNYSIHIWLVDAAGNIDFNNHVTTYLSLKSTEENGVPLPFSIVILGLIVIAISFYLFKSKRLLNQDNPKV